MLDVQERTVGSLQQALAHELALGLHGLVAPRLLAVEDGVPLEEFSWHPLGLVLV